MKYYLSILAMVVVICLPAAGEEVAFGFRGTVHELDGEFSYFTGQTFEIVYSFEPATRDVDPGDSGSGSYVGAIKSGTLTISRGEESLTWVVKPEGSHNFIEVRNLDDADSYSAGASVSGPVGRDEIPASFTVELTDRNAASLDSDALPAALEDGSFRHQRIVRFTFRGKDQNIYATIGVITAAYTPAPKPVDR